MKHLRTPLYVYLALASIIFFCFNPLIFGDTGGYTNTSMLISSGTLEGYDSARTLGYPFFVFLVSYIFSSKIDSIPSYLTAEVITLIQLFALMFSIKIMYEKICLHRNIYYGIFFLTLISPALFIYTRAILPEAICLSLVMFLAIFILCKKYTYISYAIAALIFIKPNFLPYSVLIAIWLALKVKKVKILIPLFSVYMAIGTFNFFHIGEFSQTILTGMSKSQLVYNIFDRVDSKDAVLGEILSDHYQRELKSSGQSRADTWTRSVSDMYPMLDRMPYKKSQKEWMNGTVLLSRYIGEVADGLIFKYPDVVFKNFYSIFPKTFSYDLPGIDVRSSDPTSIDGYPNIKSNLGYKLYNFLTRINNIYIYLFEIFILFYSIYKFFSCRDALYVLIPLVIVSNKVVISIFGVFDPRYNIVLLPLLILPFFYSSSHSENSFVRAD